jgi:hypothetical protein
VFCLSYFRLLSLVEWALGAITGMVSETTEESNTVVQWPELSIKRSSRPPMSVETLAMDQGLLLSGDIP